MAKNASRCSPATTKPGLRLVRRRGTAPAWPSQVASATTIGGRMNDDWARPVVHWEMEARDPARQGMFYGQLFNWDISDGAIMQISPGIGGPEPGPAGHLRLSERSGVTLYIQVRHLDASLKRASDLGG